MDKKRAKKAIVAGIIIAELAVLDYCAYMVMTHGVTIEISQEDMKEGE